MVAEREQDRDERGTRGRIWRYLTLSIKVIIPTALRAQTNNEDEIELSARTVNDALKQLTSLHPSLRRYLYSDGDRLRNFINIYVNEEDIRYLNGEQTAVKDGDTLMIVPSVAGGHGQSHRLPNLT